MTVFHRGVVVAVWTALLSCALAAPSWACVCLSFLSFDETTRLPETTAVVVGRVIAIGGAAKDPVSVDVDVTWVAKGRVPATRTRIWNVMAGSSCGGALSVLTTGRVVAFAAAPAHEARERMVEVWKLMGLNIPSADLVLTPVCGEAVRILRSTEDLRRYVGKVIQ